MRSMGGEVSYASSITTLRKPEPSSVLSAAQTSAAAVEFLKTARFPKAIVEQETQGSSVEINDLKDQAMQPSNHAIVADITLDKSARVISCELQWQKISTRP
jgi:fructose-specific phosphotransferase system component IIB